MPIISVEIMKAIDERERCDTRCIVMRWSHSFKENVYFEADFQI